IGAPSKTPPTLPLFARNSAMVFAFQSLMANSFRPRSQGMCWRDAPTGAVRLCPAPQLLRRGSGNRPGRRSAAVLPEGKDDALVDGAAFQLSVGLGGLLHGHGWMRAPAEAA